MTVTSTTETTTKTKPKLSSSYRPRPQKTTEATDQASTPQASTSITPRFEGSGNGFKLKDEVALEIIKVSQVISTSANVQMLGQLPAPISRTLGPKYLMTPKNSPTLGSFKDFASGVKRPLPSEDLVGLGLTLNPSKRSRGDTRNEMYTFDGVIGSQRHAGPSKAGWHAGQWTDLHLSYVAPRFKL
jgi:hypothetical protein